MTKWRWLTKVEVFFGPLLATVFLIPFLVAGAVGVGFSILATLTDPAQSPSERLRMAQPQLMLILWVAGAVVGVWALWVAVLRREAEAGYRPRVRLTLVACLLIGVVAASRGLWLMLRHQPGYGILTWATWLALLLGPLLISARHIWRLAFPQRGRDA